MSRNMTKAEQLIWFNILKSDKTGFRWKKQKIVGNYILDFYCDELSLVIEIDGESHNDTVEYDQIRTNFLNSLGLSVIRYQNVDIYNNLDGVAQDLKQRLQTPKPLKETPKIKDFDPLEGVTPSQTSPF